MILDIDVGNSRIKWRIRDSDRFLEKGALARGEDEWNFLADLEGQGLERVRVSNVAGPTVSETLRRQVNEVLGLVPEFAAAASKFAGLTSGYDEPSKLGVDRWLALLAAWRATQGACVVIDAGSALTIDFVDVAGVHLGGFITPGWTMLINALWDGTDAVKVDATRAGELRPGTCTATAVANGCVGMMAAFCGHATELGFGAEGNIFITGGDGPWLMEHMPGSCRFEPDLVLNGLAYALP